MPRNVEIKARVVDLDELKQRGAQISGSAGTLIEQEDTFFNAPNGRLKLRQLKGSPAQLIFYVRSDTEGPKMSDYTVTETQDPENLKATLTQALGIRGCVKKRRWLYLVGQTRIHVDEVQGLGKFMELEVCLTDDQSLEDGQTIALQLMQDLGIPETSLVKGAYLDLIRMKTEQSTA